LDERRRLEGSEDEGQEEEDSQEEEDVMGSRITQPRGWGSFVIYIGWVGRYENTY
jgi:hypothetical protein